MIRKAASFVKRLFASYYMFILCFSLFSLILWPLLSLRFPPGGDLGHMLALSYTFEGIHVEGTLKYAPILPFLFFLLYRISFGSFTVLSALIKILSVTLLFVLGASFYLLSKQLSNDRCAGNLAFFLAVLNPLFLYQILWGGPQFLGMICALLTVFWLLKIEEDSKQTVLACAFFAALTVGSHFHSAVFLAIYILVYSTIHVFTLNRKKVFLSRIGATIALIVPLSMPFLPTYLRIINDFKTMTYPTTAWDRIGSMMIVTHLPLSLELVIAVVVATLIYVKRYRDLNRLTEVLLILAISSVAILIVTPPESSNRIFYFLTIPAILLLSTSFGKIIKQHDCSKRTIGIKLLVIGLMVLMFFSSFSHYIHLIGYFSPLNDDVFEAFKEIEKDSKINERTIVLSQNPNFDGWWFEATAKRNALIDGSFMWYRLQSEIDRVIMARTLLYGTHIIDGGNLRLLNNSPDLANNTLLITTISGAGALNLITFDDALTNVIVYPESNSSNMLTVTPALAPRATTRMNDTLLVEYEYDCVTIEKSLMLDPVRDLAIIKYMLGTTNSSLIQNATIGLTSYYGVMLQNFTKIGKTFHITYIHKQTGMTGQIDIEVETNATVKAEFLEENLPGKSCLFLTLKPFSTNATLLNATIKMKLEGIDVSIPTTYSIYEKFEEEQIGYVYIRGHFSWTKRKFELDPFFEKFFEAGEVTVYKHVK